MSKFIRDDKAIIGLTLTQIGLMIATGILIATVFSFIFTSDWQRNAELKNIASSFSTMLEGMDTKFYDNVTDFNFPDTDYYYNVSMSTEYVVISAHGNWNNELSVKKRLLIRPWPQNSTLSTEWVGGNELHQFLREKFGASGNISDPIQIQDVEAVKSILNENKTKIAETLALSPLFFSIDKPVHIDKTIIYYVIEPNFEECRWGKNWTECNGEVTIEGNEIARISRGIDDGEVWYDFVIPQQYSNPQFITVGTLWKDIGTPLLHDGARLSIYNWSNSSYDTLVEDLGDKTSYTWTWVDASYPQHYIQLNTVRIRFDISDGEGFRDDTWIKRICLKIESPTNEVEKQDFVFVYQ